VTLLATAVTTLTITVWPGGMAGPSERWTLRCGPTGGTSPFRRIPKNALCTQIYGGPHVARVTGRFRGNRIWAEFRRRDGCEIARWERLGPLLPLGDA
jgi:hypothetical protein